MNVRVSAWIPAVLVAAVIALVVGLAAASPAAAADRPPQNLHLVGDHWTAWEPPVPPAGVQVYVIARGDTLWDLAKRFYGDPYLWPQLWEKNRYILDAHWIYPGDPLLTGIEVAPAALAETTPEPETIPGAAPAAPSVPKPGVLTAGAAAGAPVALGVESDIYCSGYVGDLDEHFPYTIVGSEYDVLEPRLGLGGGGSFASHGAFGAVGTAKVGLSTGDIVYLSGGRSSGLTAGSLFTVVQPSQPIVHPVYGDVFGRYYRYLGRLRVLSVQEETAIAEIVHSCDPITLGAELQPFQPEPVPLGRAGVLRPINFPTEVEKLAEAPTILLSRDDIVSLGTDHVVYIDRGAQDEVTPGDIYTIYRINRPGLPPVVLGELAVLSVHPRSSVAKIIKSRYEIFAGDRLDRK